MSNAAIALVLFLAPASAVELRRKADAIQVAEPSKPDYFWPSGRGFVGARMSGGATLAKAPFDLEKSLSWTWHGNASRYSNVPNGVNIDEQKNIYLTSLDGIRKFSQDGALLWEFTPPRVGGEEFPDTACLYNGALYVSTTFGKIFAISMSTGEKIWQTQVERTDGNNGWVSVGEGVVITGSAPSDMLRGKHVGRAGDGKVTGLDATGGKVLWNFIPEAPVWNFQASFAGDGTFIFQDYEGRAYRNLVSDGSRIWTMGGFEGSWTDGSAILGPNNVVYTQNNRGPGGPGVPGDVVARKLQNGELLWKVEVPHPPNNIPAVGRLFGNKGLSLVQPIGQQVSKDAPTYVYALDAETGELQWIFDGPRQKDDLQAGDSNPQAREERKTIGHVREITLPNPWSAPSIDGSGTVYIGSEEGPFYALRDANGDGKVDGNGEVSKYDTYACFSGSASPAIAPGMLVVPSIDQLYVFKE